MTHTNTRPRSRLALPLAAVALVSWIGCESAEQGERLRPQPPEGALEQPEDFASHRELVRAVREDRYAEQAELPQIEPERPSAPEPLTVRFESGTAVPEAALPGLRGLAKTMQEDEALQLVLVGCSDPSGPAALNQRISAQRAESVAAAIRELGVPGSRIADVEGRGEDCDEPERAVHVTAQREADSRG